MSEREARKQAKRRMRTRGRSSTVYVPISPHVRLYAWELDCPAYRTLSPEARALLVELRALYKPSNGKEIFLSVRDARKRLAGIGQAKVQAAFAALMERGWIEEASSGSFDQKTGTGRARSFFLTNIGPAGDEVDAKKTYMQWRPPVDPYAGECQKNTVLRASTVAYSG